MAKTKPKKKLHKPQHQSRPGRESKMEPEPVFAETIEAGDGWPLLKSRGKHEPLPQSYFNALIDEAREHRHRETTDDEL